MSKLDKNQRVQSSKGRNVFDLSHGYRFTATTGQLRPVSHDLLQAGDTVSCKFDFFVRSMPLSTATMVDIDFFVDYFFVPLELIWLPFGAWWSQTRSLPYGLPLDIDGFSGNGLPPLNSLPLVSSDVVFQSINATDQKFQDFRLCEDLGFSGLIYNDNAGFVVGTAGSDSDPDTFNYPSFFPWQFASYECIYQHFYRDEEREPFSPDAYSWNDTSGSFSTVGKFRLRYLNRQDDYFTASKLSPLVANINNNPSFLGNFEVGLGQNVFGFDNLIYYNLGLPDSNLSPNNVFNEGSTYNSHNSSNDSRAINQLRALFAEEKLLHVMNMTNKNYDSQVLARLGYDVPKDIKHQIHHLGHDTCRLDIQEIVSGSNTFNGESGSVLGDLAGQGKGVSRNFKGVKSFTAPCHGVLMSIFTCRTRPSYTSSALRKDMMSDITDFFTPELDDLGMQPQYQYETRIVNRQGKTVLTQSYVNPYTITGWNYRFEYLKRNIDRSSLAFMRSQDGLASYDSDSGAIDVGYNSFSQWNFARTPFDNAYKTVAGQYVPEDDFYSRPHFDLYKVSPYELNLLRPVNWLDRPPVDDKGDPLEDWVHRPWLIFQRDPFLVDGRFECKKVSAMSIYSMPKFM